MIRYFGTNYQLIVRKDCWLDSYKEYWPMIDFIMEHIMTLIFLSTFYQHISIHVYFGSRHVLIPIAEKAFG